MNEFYSTLRNEEYKHFVESKGGSGFSADYISWAVMHDKLKKNFQYVSYKIHEYEVQNENGSTVDVPYMLLPNGTAMVKITLKVTDKDGDVHTHEECLAVRDFRMNAAKTPDSAQVENTIRRCIAKAGSMLTGFGIELWFGEDIKDLDYRPETLMSGKIPTEGHITKTQEIKLRRLCSDPVFNKTETEDLTVKWIEENPTEEQAGTAIIKLTNTIKKKRKEKKEAA